jgi:tRNA(Ile)-lysidine synthase
MNAWEKFKLNLAKNSLVKPGDRVVLAVSGGPDSVCMAHMFWRLKKVMPLELLMLYLDHGIRKKAAHEIKFLQNLSKQWGVGFQAKKIGVIAHSDNEKKSLETAGRELRYRELVDTAKKLGFNKIATGHNANDNAESVLMFIIRGTGQEGLSGIPYIRKSGEKNIKIIRPILPLSKPEIIDYLGSQELKYCIDHTNFHLKFTRNRIRHKLISDLEKYNTKFIDHIFNMSRIVSMENEYLNDLTQKAVNRIFVKKSNKIILDLRGFFRYNKVLQLKAIKQVLPERKSLDNIYRVHGWILSDNSTSFNLSSRWVLEKIRGRVVFKKIHGKNKSSFN